MRRRPIEILKRRLEGREQVFSKTDEDQEKLGGRFLGIIKSHTVDENMHKNYWSTEIYVANPINTD